MFRQVDLAKARARVLDISMDVPLGMIHWPATRSRRLNGSTGPVGGHSAQDPLPATIVLSIDRDRRRIHRDRQQTETLGWCGYL
jgi:hypothetical protein